MNAAKFQAAFDDYLSLVCAYKSDAARKHGLDYPAFAAWTKRPAQRAYARSYRRPIAKPGGKLL